MSKLNDERKTFRGSMSQEYSLILYTDQKPFVKLIDAYLTDTHYKIKGISGRFEEILTLLTHHAPDFLVINLLHPCTNPNIHQLKIASPRTRIIISEEKCNSQNIYDLIQAGADSFIPIPFFREDIIEALAALERDEIFFPPYVARSILQKSREINPATHEFPFILTERDQTILWCLARGQTVKEIESSLGIEGELIHAHLTNIIQKIHFSDIVQNHLNEKWVDVRTEIDHQKMT
jgi:DNA-binding NarL/FixJ family response regulator